MPTTPTLPAHLRLILDAANTFDVEEQRDAWETPAQLAQWLHRHAGTSSSGKVTAREHRDALTFRDGLRDLLTERTSSAFAAASAPFTLRTVIHDGRPELEPADAGTRGGVARIAAAIARAGADGSWDRVKICPADDCLFAFYDESRNRSRTWCSMRVCGNRTKTRAYRARHQPT
jgi:predicted RNA-binding Zn ribbon-like protein